MYMEMPWHTKCPACDAGLAGTPDARYDCSHFEDEKSNGYLRSLVEASIVIWSKGALESFTATIIKSLAPTDAPGKTLSNAYLKHRFGLDDIEVHSFVFNLLDMHVVNIIPTELGHWGIKLSAFGNTFLHSVCEELMQKKLEALSEGQENGNN